MGTIPFHFVGFEAFVVNLICFGCEFFYVFVAFFRFVVHKSINCVTTIWWTHKHENHPRTLVSVFGLRKAINTIQIAIHKSQWLETMVIGHTKLKYGNQRIKWSNVKQKIAWKIQNVDLQFDNATILLHGSFHFHCRLFRWNRQKKTRSVFDPFFLALPFNHK